MNAEQRAYDERRERRVDDGGEDQKDMRIECGRRERKTWKKVRLDGSRPLKGKNENELNTKSDE